jgi:hypothetical protein
VRAVLWCAVTVSMWIRIASLLQWITVLIVLLFGAWLWSSDAVACFGGYLKADM